MKFGGLSRISAAMLKSGQEAARVLDDTWNRLENAFTSLSFEDNFKSRSVKFLVQNGVNTFVGANNPNIILLKRFTPEDGSLVVCQWAWRPVPAGIELLVQWTGSTNATIELFIEER